MTDREHIRYLKRQIKMLERRVLELELRPPAIVQPEPWNPWSPVRTVPWQTDPDFRKWEITC